MILSDQDNQKIENDRRKLNDQFFFQLASGEVLEYGDQVVDRRGARGWFNGTQMNASIVAIVPLAPPSGGVTRRTIYLSAERARLDLRRVLQ